MEIPIVIFTMGVIALLFLILIGATGKKQTLEQMTFSTATLQETYPVENAVSYIFDRTFEYAAIQAYYSSAYNTMWLYDCGSTSYGGKTYRKLCINSKIDETK